MPYDTLAFDLLTDVTIGGTTYVVADFCDIEERAGRRGTMEIQYLATDKSLPKIGEAFLYRGSLWEVDSRVRRVRNDAAATLTLSLLHLTEQ